MKFKSYFFFAGLTVLVTLLAIISCDNRTLEPVTMYITEMTAKPDTIYADNNVTYSTISVTVKDDDNFAVTGEPVRFRCTIGNLIYEVLTDSSGVAQSTFWDNGAIGIATIDAFVGDASSSTTVTILEEPDIESITITAANVMKVAKTTLIRADITSEIGNVPDGTLVVFEADRGFFQDAAGGDLGGITQIQTNNSIARVTFNSGTETGTANITVKISDVQAQHTIEIQPGIATQIFLAAIPDEIQVNSGEESQIIAALADSYNNPVLAGVGVSFTTTLGNITAFSITDQFGIATSTFTSGIQAGIAEITAVSDSASATTAVTVYSDNVYSIAFAFPGNVSINVKETGGQETFECIVNLYDSNGNLIDQPETVWFKFMNGPTGVNINNQIFMPSTDSLSVVSENGRATVSVNSGYISGPVALKVFVCDENGVPTISAVKSNIVVNSGPPAMIDVSIGDIDSGSNMGGGIWQIECAATINDEWGNPVGYGTAVWFSLTDPENPGIVPSWATIQAAAYVQNQNASGDSLQGVAYTLLNFEGTHINDTLIVWVSVSGAQTFIASAAVTLPLQFGNISMIATPSHLDWNAQTNNQPILYTTIRVYVTDGQNNPINYQIIHFTSSHGFPVPGPAFPLDPYKGMTYEVPANGDGWLFKEFGFYKYECAPPIPAPPGTTQVTIEASIPGTDVTSQVTITLNRYID